MYVRCRGMDAAHHAGVRCAVCVRRRAFASVRACVSGWLRSGWKWFVRVGVFRVELTLQRPLDQNVGRSTSHAVRSMARAGAERAADRHAKLGTVRVPIAHAVAGTIRRGRVQLAAAVALADAAAVRIAEPEPDGSSDGRAEPAADNGTAVIGAHPLRACACTCVAAAWMAAWMLPIMRACVAQCACGGGLSRACVHAYPGG